MTGTCKPMKQQRRASEPLAIEQFLSAYLLLGIGMVLAVVLLGLEHIYFKYMRKHLAKKDSGGCCALVSLVSNGWVSSLYYFFLAGFLLSVFIYFAIFQVSF